MGLAWYREIEGEWIPPAQAVVEPEPGEPVRARVQWLPLVLDRQEVRSFLAAPGLSELERLVLRTLYSSALRVEELIALSAESVDLESSSLHLVGGRQVLVDEETFRGLSGLDWSSWSWTVDQVVALVQRAGAAGRVAERYAAMGRTLLPKALRYWCGAHCLENGMDLYTLHKLMGHTYVDTTESIMKLAVGRWRQLYDQCHPLSCQRLMGGNEQSHLAVDEVFQMLKEADKVGNPVDAERNRMIVRLLYAGGMRVAELAGLVYGDVFYDEARVFIRQGKGSKDRYILLDRETADQLRAFQADKPLSELIFDIRERQIANVVKKVGERTGLLEKYKGQGYSLSPHSFRHAYATHLYRNHMDSLGLEKLMGHTDLETTFANYVSCDLAYWQAGYDKSHELAGHRD